jgi:hypothetical protein
MRPIRAWDLPTWAGWSSARKLGRGDTLSRRSFCPLHTILYTLPRGLAHLPLARYLDLKIQSIQPDTIICIGHHKAVHVRLLVVPFTSSSWDNGPPQPDAAPLLYHLPPPQETAIGSQPSTRFCAEVMLPQHGKQGKPSSPTWNYIHREQYSRSMARYG